MKTKDLTCITKTFEGSPLTTLTYRGRPAWIAREVGAAIGYSHGGKRLPNKVTGDWNAEFIEGHDYMLLAGEDLAAFKAARFEGTESVPSKANRGILILFEPGLHLVLAKTNKPIGIRLRRFIVDEVLPQLVRDGHYAPSCQVVDGQLVERKAPDPRVQRELRLARKLELEDRKFKVRTLQQTIAGIEGRVSADAITSLRVVAADIALERDLSDLKPRTGAGWLPPSEIAKRLGVSANRVGRAISKLDLRGDIPGMAMPIMNKARHSDRNVVSYLYSPEAARRIERQLRADGHIPPAANAAA